MKVQRVAPCALIIFFSFSSVTYHPEDSARSCSPSSAISAYNFWHLVASAATDFLMFSSVGASLHFLIHHTCLYCLLNTSLATVSSFKLRCFYTDDPPAMIRVRDFKRASCALFPVSSSR